MSAYEKVTVIIPSLNEESNIENCIRSVLWANEIILADGNSTDHTVEIALKYGAKILNYVPAGYADPIRQNAVGHAKNDWILFLDADEMIPPLLAQKIVKIVRENIYDIVYIPRENYFLGAILASAGWGANQDILPRLFRKGSMSFDNQIHAFDHPNENSKKIYLNVEPFSSIIHFNYLSLEHFLDKLNKYTTIGSKLRFDKKKKVTNKKILIDIFYEFYMRYFKLRGYRNGIRGFVMSAMMSFYRLAEDYKLYLNWQTNSENVAEAVKTIYSKIANEIIEEYSHTHGFT